jgi:hypothetical protein
VVCARPTSSILTGQQCGVNHGNATDIESSCAFRWDDPIQENRTSGAAPTPHEPLVGDRDVENDFFAFPPRPEVELVFRPGLIANGTFYQDLGTDHFERHSKPTQMKRLVAKLQSLGYEVQIKPRAA